MILEDANTHSSELGFAQPVAIDRLVPYALCELEEPVAGDPPRLELCKNGVGRAGAVRAQNATGSVDILFDDGEELMLDLGAEEYRWLSRDAAP